MNTTETTAEPSLLSLGDMVFHPTLNVAGIVIRVEPDRAWVDFPACGVKWVPRACRDIR